MVIKFDINISEQELHDFITDWVNLLAIGQYKNALDSVLQDGSWSAELLETIINGYGIHYEVDRHVKYVVTPTSLATGDGDRFDIMWFEDNVVNDKKNIERLAEIWFQLPLNGEWSDLTVTFELLKIEGFLYLELNEVHMF